MQSSRTSRTRNFDGFSRFRVGPGKQVATSPARLQHLKLPKASKHRVVIRSTSHAQLGLRGHVPRRLAALPSACGSPADSSPNVSAATAAPSPSSENPIHFNRGNRKGGGRLPPTGVSIKCLAEKSVSATARTVLVEEAKKDDTHQDLHQHHQNFQQKSLSALQQLSDSVDPILEQVNGSLLKWRAESILGMGSEGQVLKAFNLNSGEIFAVKRLFTKSDAQLPNPEITILQRLRHAHIVKFLGAEVVQNNTCIYLEYMPGGNVKGLLSQPLPEQIAARYTRQMLEGLQYLHSQGVVHRDLKAANLLLDASGSLKLSDFGCSKLFSSDAESGLVGTVRGSLAWTAPEVVRQRGYGRRADIWSVGCTVLEMLSGKSPWADVGDYLKVVMKLLNSESLPVIPQHVSHQAKSFMEMCLRRDPTQRATIAELLKHEFLFKPK